MPVVFLLLRLAGRRRAARLSAHDDGPGRCRWPAEEHGLYSTYSLILATFLGTMGLPHVLVRFYTNPDGRAARRTTLVVLACSAPSTCCPPIYGVLGRIYAPDLVAGDTDAVVLDAARPVIGGTSATCSAALVRPGRSRRSCPRRPG